MYELVKCTKEVNELMARYVLDLGFIRIMNFMSNIKIIQEIRKRLGQYIEEYQMSISIQ